MSAFFEEVKRRKVYRVAVAYAVVAWLSIQVSATIFPAWEMPVWALRLEKSVAEVPSDPKRLSALAGILAALGEKEAAIAQARRATELLPESVDAFDGPHLTQGLAEVYALSGEEEKAIDLLAGLLSRPSTVSVATLKVVPIWDGLRDNPRFVELLRKHGGPA